MPYLEEEDEKLERFFLENVYKIKDDYGEVLEINKNKKTITVPRYILIEDPDFYAYLIEKLDRLVAYWGVNWKIG